MVVESNQDLILQFYKSFDDRNIDQALELLAPNFVAHLAGTPKPLDSEEFKQFGMTFYVAFQKGQHRFDEVIVQGDRVVTCGTFTATHIGEFQGLPPTGKQIKLAVMHIDRVKDDKIIEHWGHGDALGLMQQLGIIFLPGPSFFSHVIKHLTSKLFRRSTSAPQAH